MFSHFLCFTDNSSCSKIIRLSTDRDFTVIFFIIESKRDGGVKDLIFLLIITSPPSSPVRDVNLSFPSEGKRETELAFKLFERKVPE